MFPLTLTIVVVLVLGGVLLAWRGYNSRRDDALEEFGNGADRRRGGERSSPNGSPSSTRSPSPKPCARAMSRRSGPSWHRSRRRSSGSTTWGLSTRTGSCKSMSPWTSATGVTSRISPTPTPRTSARRSSAGSPTNRSSCSPCRQPARTAPGGILVATVHVANAAEMIPTDAGDRLQIVDRDGNLIYDGGPLSDPAPPANPTALALPEGDAEAASGLGGQADKVVARAEVDNAAWQIVLARAESSVGATARDAFIRELVLLGGVGFPPSSARGGSPGGSTACTAPKWATPGRWPRSSSSAPPSPPPTRPPRWRRRWEPHVPEVSAPRRTPPLTRATPTGSRWSP